MFKQIYNIEAMYEDRDTSLTQTNYFDAYD